MNIGGTYFKTFPRLHQYLATQDMMALKEGDGKAIFMSKGLGKTKVVLDWITNKKMRGNLVIIPRIAWKTWKDELETHSNLSAFLYGSKDIGKSFRLILTRYDLIIMSYETARTIGINAFRSYNWNSVILDESTKIKNLTTQISNVCLQSFNHATYRIILSGRPITNTPIDIFTQYWFLDDGYTFGKSLSRFRDEFFFMGYSYRWFLKPAMRHEFYRRISKKAIIYTSKFMMKYEGRAFPKQITKSIFLGMNKQQKKYMANLIDEFRVRLRGKVVYETDYRLAVDSKLRQIGAGFIYVNGGDTISFQHPKIKVLHDILEEISDKTVIFTTFKEERENLYVLLKKWYPERQITMLQSGMSIDDIEISITEHEASSTGLLLSNAAFARYSLSLSTTRYAIYFTRSFSFETYDQSRGRIARLSTLFPDVYYYNLIYKDSIERLIHDALTQNWSDGQYLDKVVSIIQERRR